MFNQQEVQILLGGVNSPIDLDDLRQHTLYGGLYDPNAETIVSFWNVCTPFQESHIDFNYNLREGRQYVRPRAKKSFTAIRD